MDWKISNKANKSKSIKLFNRSEKLRIKNYLAHAELKLRLNMPEELSSTQMLNRETAINNLSIYRKGDLFPKNDYVPKMTSVFIDRSGTICAVANLIDKSGRRDLVETIAEKNNLLTLSQERTEILDSWLYENGITYEEAAFVQVPYNAQPELIEKAKQSGHNNLALIVTVIFVACTLVLFAGVTLRLFMKKRTKAKALLSEEIQV